MLEFDPYFLTGVLNYTMLASVTLKKYDCCMCCMLVGTSQDVD